MSRLLKLSRELHGSKPGRRIHTLGDALDFIDRDVPKDRRHAPHWRHSREALTKAIRSKDPVEIERATTQLERALRRDMAASAAGADRAAGDPAR